MNIIVTVLQQVRSHAVPERMATAALGNASPSYSILEDAHLGRPHLLGIPLVMEQDKTSDPVHIRVFGTDISMLEA